MLSYFRVTRGHTVQGLRVQRVVVDPNTLSEGTPVGGPRTLVPDERKDLLDPDPDPPQRPDSVPMDPGQIYHRHWTSPGSTVPREMYLPYPTLLYWLSTTSNDNKGSFGTLRTLGPFSVPRVIDPCTVTHYVGTRDRSLSRSR